MSAIKLSRNIRFVAVVLALGLGMSAVGGPANAMHPEGVLKEHWDGFAIKGYDPVAYYTMGQALKGSEEFAH